jgi:hypothetical protein
MSSAVRKIHARFDGGAELCTSATGKVGSEELS